MYMLIGNLCCFILPPFIKFILKKIARGKVKLKCTTLQLRFTVSFTYLRHFGI